MEEYLSDTYGVTVYQEQVMLLSQKLAGFTKGQADGLRKAMGKKLADKMAELKTKFIDGGKAKGHSEEILMKIWKDWEAFAQYAFNKSHATCYAWVGYQTAYLKANYPAEYMAATLSKNLNDITEITKLMDESKRIGISVLGPDVNESSNYFTVNKDGNIRFGMAGVKGVGMAAVDAIIAEREKNGPFESVFDFVSRVNLNSVNKRTVESLAYSGAFDSFEEIPNRAVFEMVDAKGESFLESLMKYGNKVQSSAADASTSLFGDSELIKPAKPAVPVVPDFNKLEFLRRERDLVGMYLSSHPLDMYRFEIENFTNSTIGDAVAFCDAANSDPKATADSYRNSEIIVAGLVTSVKNSVSSKSNKPYCSFTLEDFSTSKSFSLFGKDYEQFMKYMQEGMPLLVKCTVLPKFGFQAARKAAENGDKIEFELKIAAMTLLANTRDSFVKEIRINLPVSKIDDHFRTSLKKAVKDSEGKSSLVLNVLDYANNVNVEFFSKKYYVAPTQQLLGFLSSSEIDYSIEKNIMF